MCLTCTHTHTSNTNKKGDGKKDRVGLAAHINIIFFFCESPKSKKKERGDGRVLTIYRVSDRCHIMFVRKACNEYSVLISLLLYATNYRARCMQRKTTFQLNEHPMHTHTHYFGTIFCARILPPISYQTHIFLYYALSLSRQNSDWIKLSVNGSGNKTICKCVSQHCSC